MSISTSIKQEILSRLKKAETQHNIQILYACESGSRAWGFASPDSDYDVRFIYAHSTNWYLSFDIERRRDVIEYPIVDEIDCSGWDIRKALYLFSRTNGALLEWLNSPIRYIEQGHTRKNLALLAESAVNHIALCYHYSHMARRNVREYLYEDQVRLKKYFYVLRPLLAIRHIEQGMGVPPVEFETLVKKVAPSNIVDPINKLLKIKRESSELGLGTQIPELGNFIQVELDRHQENFTGQGRPDLISNAQIRNQLNTIFQDALKHEP